ncbi:lipoprotein signal peptidase [Patiriisocius sp. Uisw_047]|jgi:signal peptidase II|uniref:lipoprotein signal peptidase n=1 Tax=Patiriisocius sp. Uisw_047 TaxID=3230969 RepID=UPI0039EB88E6
MSLKKAYLIIILILIIDQISKIYIKTHFFLGEEIDVFSWFKIHFVENKGMAWGAQIPGEHGKLILTLFRIVAIAGIAWWLKDSIKKKGTRILIVAISLIFAGAFGNIIDSVFYGVLFDTSTSQVAHFLPEAGGYSTLFHGHVVDMFYFPMFQVVLPAWIPFVGGDYFTFFDPVFNVADTAISTGVGMLLVFHKKTFPSTKKEVEVSTEA